MCINLKQQVKAFGQSQLTIDIIILFESCVTHVRLGLKSHVHSLINLYVTLECSYIIFTMDTPQAVAMYVARQLVWFNYIAHG